MAQNPKEVTVSHKIAPENRAMLDWVLKSPITFRALSYLSIETHVGQPLGALYRGSVKEIIHTQPSYYGLITSVGRYTFDEYGRIERAEYRSQFPLAYHFVWSGERLVEIVGEKLSKKGQWKRKNSSKFKYNDDNTLALMNVPGDYIRFAYSQSEKLIHATRYYGGEVTMHYDDKYRLVRVNEGYSTITYHYDTAGRIVEEKEGSKSNVYEYNEQGDIISESIDVGSTSYRKNTYKYEYDAQGNWIRRIKIDSSGRPDEYAETREIIYY